MRHEDLLERIAIDQCVAAGRPVIRGTRLTVSFVIGLLASGSTFEEILAEYRGLTADDLRACLLFTKKILDEVVFVPSVEGR